MKKSTVLLILTWMLSTSIYGEERYPVSLISLIVKPEEYLGKNITVMGYLRDSQLYLNESSAEFSDIPSSIDVIDDTKGGDIITSCNNRYVAVFGKFNKHQETYEIKDIVRVRDAKTVKRCWEK
jgi:hypothetical protein